MVSVLSFLLFKQFPEFLEGIFFNPGNIRPADMKLCCNFFLRLLFNPEKTIAKTDDLIFLLGKGIFQGAEQKADVFPHRILFHDIYRRTFDNIQKADLVSFFVRSDWFVQGNLPGIFLFCSEHHQKFVVDTACSIGRKPCAACAVKGVDGFDKTDGPDGDQILQIFPGILIFLCNMGDQAEVSFDQNTFCFRIPLLITAKIYFFLSGRQGF